MIGVDSLMAVELTAILSSEMGVELPVMVLFTRMTVQRLAEVVLEELGDLAAPAAPAASPATTARESPRPLAAAGVASAAPAATDAAALPPAAAAAPPANGTVGSRIDYRALDYTRWSPLQRVARGVSRAGSGRSARCARTGWNGCRRRGRRSWRSTTSAWPTCRSR